MSGTGKRKRAAAAALPPDDLSDTEGCATAGPAERKRELERNRRNLVNVRFQELERTLGALPGAPQRVQRRLDKEVVLKEAAQRLAAQQRDLDDALARIASLTGEMGTLREEKLELRHDKLFLHREVAAARAENAGLAADNVALWEYVQKSTAAKGALEGLPIPKAAAGHAQAEAGAQAGAQAVPARAKADADAFAGGAAAFSPALLQYPFDEQQRDMASFDVGLDDIGQTDMPDIAPCA